MSPYSIFVDTNNTLYAAKRENRTILIWHEGATQPTKIIKSPFIRSLSLFVTSNGDLYVGDGTFNGRVQKWLAHNDTFVTVMHVDTRCYGLFVDARDTFYCSMGDGHAVVKKSLMDPLLTPTEIAAGTGSAGSAANELSDPQGIFVDANFDLYVADSRNYRVQLFQSGEKNAITVAGTQSLIPTITLRGPTGIVLDAEKYMFIVDSGNHRIVGSGLNGFRCLVGCYGAGTQSNQLQLPRSLGFDRMGNMFVTDTGSARIQKYRYMKKSCSKMNLPGTGRSDV